MALPSGYTWLTYIQSNGTQYINTNFVPTANTRVVMDFQLTTAGNNNLCLFGVVGQFSFRWYGTNSVFRSNGSGSANFPTGISGTARHTVDKTATTCTLDGTYSVTNTPGTVSNPLYLFAQNTGSGYSNYVSAKLYSCKIYESGSLVRDFIPAKSGSKVGLYDAANGVFYANAESGNFTAGDVYDPTAPVGDHNALIDGTAREIEGGSVMVGGTVYDIELGNTLVGGTVYEIAFGGGMVTVKILKATSSNVSQVYVSIDGVKYSGDSAKTIEVPVGTKMTCHASTSLTFGTGDIIVDGKGVATGRPAVHTYTINTPITVTLYSSTSSGSIKITTS